MHIKKTMLPKRIKITIPRAEHKYQKSLLQLSANLEELLVIIEKHVLQGDDQKILNKET